MLYFRPNCLAADVVVADQRPSAHPLPYAGLMLYPGSQTVELVKYIITQSWYESCREGGVLYSIEYKPLAASVATSTDAPAVTTYPNGWTQIFLTAQKKGCQDPLLRVSNLHYLVDHSLVWLQKCCVTIARISEVNNFQQLLMEQA